MSAALSRATTITVTERTRRLLESVKGTGETFDDLIQDLLEETFFDEEFYQEIEKRWRTDQRVPGRRVLRTAGLAGAPTTTCSLSRPRRSSSRAHPRFSGCSKRS